MDKKVQHWPKGGAYQSRGSSNGSLRSYHVPCNNSAIYSLLCLSCGACFVLSVVCSCLVTLVVLLDQKVEATNYHYDLSRLIALNAMNAKTEGRLSYDVRPEHYDIFLHPRLEEGTFSGKVNILINVLDVRKTILLHRKDLNIKFVNLTTFDREENFEIKLRNETDHEVNDLYTVIAEEDFYPGLYNLTMEFDGSLQNKIVGFYSSKYKDLQNKTRLIATSKFEPTYARQAFPCFDEPNFKATFSIKLVHPTGDCYNALSNMNVESTSIDQPAYGLTTVSFAKTVPMSTYLACFIVSDFVALTKMAKRLNGKEFPISVYTTRAQKEKASFAMDIGVKAIEYYINLFKVDYPLPKLDMAAIPDFVSGAMENWGLVTYREARLLYDNINSSISTKRDIVYVICHEFAHMWFGNLVTLAWWDDLWLNEGFATFMSYKSANSILPNWGFMEEFLTNEIHSVLVTDAKLSSHSIVQPVRNSDEITSMFDEISYEKGASVIRMMENFVGPEIFYDSITAYLLKYSYQNAETVDLLNIIQDGVGSNINVVDIMDTWTRQKGFPVINVKRNESSFILTQKRFLADPDADFDPSESKYRYKWIIPVTYMTNKRSNSTLIWFDKDANELLIDLDESIKWIKFNVDQVGYYRVNYDQEGWNTFSDLLLYAHKRLSVSDRANLLEDALSLADANELEYDVAMDMTLYLPNERHAIPWEVAHSKLMSIDVLLTSTNISTLYKSFIRDLVDGIYYDVTWIVDNNDDNVLLKLRTIVLELACSVGHTECLNDVAVIFKTWIRNSIDIRPHPDIRQLVYYYGMHHVGDETIWNMMFERFVKESDSSEKLKLMTGLAGIRSNWILNKFITTASDENYVRAQDFFKCLISISRNPVGTPLVWDWVRANWEFLVDRYTLNDRYLGALILEITKSFVTETKLNEMKAFFEKYPEAGAGVANRAKALETVSNNIKWLSRNADKFENWLKKHAPGNSMR